MVLEDGNLREPRPHERQLLLGYGRGNTAAPASSSWERHAITGGCMSLTARQALLRLLCQAACRDTPSAPASPPETQPMNPTSFGATQADSKPDQLTHHRSRPRPMPAPRPLSLMPLPLTACAFTDI